MNMKSSDVVHMYYHRKVLGVQHFPRALCGNGEPIDRLMSTTHCNRVTCPACLKYK